MKHLLLIIAVLFAHSVHATDAITWQSLKPVMTQYQSISPGNQALISEIYAYEVVQRTRQLSAMEIDGYHQRIALARKLGLNVRELLEQRDEHALEGKNIVSSLAADNIALTGYLVPLAQQDVQRTRFILVPSAGACTHTPPPPVNQTILIDFPKGYELKTLYTRVMVKGDIEAKSHETLIALSDGNQKLKAGYLIRATDIELYQ
ncbi:DUF3299 domain-containing protein [Shewanella colwelliana]|uniref:DUF3299 domain-containing protein n=1 Tax=Shewanella colwelliana TaxID=23 RepID=UPI003D078A0F